MMCISTCLNDDKADRTVIVADRSGMDVDVDLNDAELLSDRWGQLGVILPSGQVILAPSRKGEN